MGHGNRIRIGQFRFSVHNKTGRAGNIVRPLTTTNHELRTVN